MKKTVAIDFDGVLNTYDGWAGEDELFDPMPGAYEFLRGLSVTYSVVIYTTRDAEKVESWLMNYGMNRWVDRVTNTKPRAVAYVDDRAVRFEGSYAQTLKDIERSTHWEAW